MKSILRRVSFAVGLSLFVVAGVHAATPGQFPEVPRDTSLKPFVPRSLDTSPTTVIVMLEGDPVAVVKRKMGRDLSDFEIASVIASRKADHASVMPEIRRRGGTVVGSFQSALNGIKVTIARNRVNSLRSIPGVVDIKTVGTYKLDNTVSVPFIGAPLVWQATKHLQGQGIKIGIIDTGIDYTHADFGGPGTVAAFNAAKATNTAIPNPAYFGPTAPKVKGGTDLVGDAYTGQNTPVPDPNPLDCNGHGSHVAGTAAGFGVNADGSTFHGPYGSSAYTPGAFLIGPGVAPMADIYSIRVFGCTGSTNVVNEAIDWAVANGMNVISMSLGSDFGSADSGAESVSVANAIAAGIIVVAASGNSGNIPYITSAPAASDGAIAVAAMDSTASYAGASLTLPGVPNPVIVQDNNGAAFGNGTSYPVVVLRNPNGTVSFGCSAAEYDPTQGGTNVVGKLVVTVRGSSCARVFRAGAAQHYGAAAVVLINNGAGYPPFEGPIPADGVNNPYEPVTIPFFGALSSDTLSLSGPVGGPAPATAVASNAPAFANPGFERVASFSSSGPRTGDSAFRPAISGPGVSIPSVASGTGTGFVIESGTSMATPHVAGVAALVKQANPTWSGADLRAAIVQTASPSLMQDYSPRLEGSGVVQPFPAVNTQAVIRSPDDSLSFGYADLLTDFSGTQNLTLHNTGPKAVKFNIAVNKVVGPSAATITVPTSVIVNGNADAVIPVTLGVPAASVGGTHDGGGNCCLFEEIGGYLQFTPSDSRLNGNAALTVPYYLVAHTRSNLTTNATSVSALPTGSNNLTMFNTSGAFTAFPDFYSLGQFSRAPQGIRYADTRAIGVQSNIISASDSFLVFAINTFGRVSNPAGFLEWDIYIDSTGNGTGPNYLLIGYNGSAFSSSATVVNKLSAALLNLNTGTYTVLRLADAATDNSTMLLPVLASEIGVSPSNPRFTYFLNFYDDFGNGATMPGAPGSFNVFNPALNVTGSPTIPPNTSASATVSVNSTEAAITPPLGLMIVAPDNNAGAAQARLIPLAPPAPN